MALILSRNLEQAQRWFHALSDETRLQLLELIARRRAVRVRPDRRAGRRPVPALLPPQDPQGLWSRDRPAGGAVGLLRAEPRGPQCGRRIPLHAAHDALRPPDRAPTVQLTFFCRQISRTVDEPTR